MTSSISPRLDWLVLLYVCSSAPGIHQVWARDFMFHGSGCRLVPGEHDPEDPEAVPWHVIANLSSASSFGLSKKTNPAKVFGPGQPGGEYRRSYGAQGH
ncbi:hypothetical protein GGR51DRAFT_211928 [Nemania sp. FL0031]|nr:hypothetical protein GGR51DRAFT_211928 [Nemania sp. FL0031]